MFLCAGWGGRMSKKTTRPGVLAPCDQHTARIDFFPTSRENAPIFACRAENQSSRRGARCASSTHSPCPAAAHTRTSGTALKPTRHEHPGRQREEWFHAHEASRRASRPFWPLAAPSTAAARMLRIQPFFRDSSTPSTHRTVHIKQDRPTKLLRRGSKSGT